MKVLIVTEQLHEIDSIPTSLLIGSFQSVFGEDESYELIVRHINQNDVFTARELSEVLLNTDYDIAVVSPLWQVHVELETAKIVGKKLFIVLWDSHAIIPTSNRYVNFRSFLKSKPQCGHTFMHTCFEYAEYCNILVMDYGYGEAFPNIYCTPVPQDIRLLFPIPESEKKIDLLFFGKISTNERKFYIESIKKTSMPLEIYGDNELSSWEEFGEINRSAKMTLVLGEKPWGEGQVKSKIYEAAACGSMPLVSHPYVYKDKNGVRFIENEHFVSIDKINYLDKIKYYLENPQERIKISQNLHKFYMENYSPKPFWYNIFKYAKDK